MKLGFSIGETVISIDNPSVERRVIGITTIMGKELLWLDPVDGRDPETSDAMEWVKKRRRHESANLDANRSP